MFESLINDSIVCLGCSFTYGVGSNKNYENWPYFLYKKLKNQRVINMSHGGTSLLHAVFTLEYIFHNNLKPKFIFFQVTNPYRLTLRQDQIKEREFELVDGETDFYMTGIDTLTTNSLGDLKSKWVKNYYISRDPDKDVLWDTEHKAQLAYSKKMLENYNHCLYSQEKETIYESFVEFALRGDIFDEDCYSKNIIDKGDHLSVEALKKQAEYMMTKIY